MEPQKNDSSASVVADLAKMALNPDQRTIDTSAGPAILLVDKDGNETLALVENVARQELRGRVVQGVTLETEESLIQYVNRGKTSAAVLMASISSSVIFAVLDYHAPTEASDAGAPAGDAYGSHTAKLVLPLSLEWKTWEAIDGKMLSQLHFCRFLEENREDIAAPAAGVVLDACSDLQGLRRVDFQSAVREDSNNVKIEYKDEKDVRNPRGDISLPTEFTIRIPVYFGGPAIEIDAILRWEVTDDGVLTLGFKLKRLERVRQEEFKRIVADVSTDTDVPAFYGALVKPF